MGREKMYFVNQADNSTVDVRERITEEQVSEIERSGLDPLAAPPGPYTVQPDRQGRLVWLTGPPGAGKSTSAQLLGRLHGWVYYEVDCFTGLRNPFIPLDVVNPSMMQTRQKSLEGEGREERKLVVDKMSEFWKKAFRNVELSSDDWNMLESFHDLLCQDILTQRR